MNELKQALLETNTCKRIKELEPIIDQNPLLQDKIKKLKDKQKQMVNALEYHQEKQYQVYLKEYQDLYQEVLDFPFVSEYIDLLTEMNDILLDIAKVIEDKINKVLDQ